MRPILAVIATGTLALVVALGSVPSASARPDALPPELRCVGPPTLAIPDPTQLGAGSYLYTDVLIGIQEPDCRDDCQGTLVVGYEALTPGANDWSCIPIVP
jgi:hypothetical protein